MSGLGWCPPLKQDRSRISLLLFLSVFLFVAITLACNPTSDPITSLETTSSPNPRTNPIAAASPSVGIGQIELPRLTDQRALPSLAELVEQIKPSVASISVESISRGVFFDFTNEGAGSGFVVSPNGHIVTNSHVIADAKGITVTLPDGNSYEAIVVGQDRLTDLAVIKIDAENLPSVTLGDSGELKVGDWVMAMGNLLALKGGPSVTLGIVSAKGRAITTEGGALYDMLQIDAVINDGNSGGPLVNLKGEVVGINTAVLRQAQGIGFAVSSSAASPIIDSLINHSRVVRPLIGLTGADVTPSRAYQLNLSVTEGIIVTRLSHNGPIAKAGVQIGDVITKIDSIPTPDMARFLTLLWSYRVGDVVEIEYIRDSDTYVTNVELVERPQSG